jgi:hypothetical protein
MKITLFEDLVSLVADLRGDYEKYVQVRSEDEIPEPYRELLVHHSHMTVALERWYNSRVKIVVLREKHEEPYYGRLIHLCLEGTERVVEYGIMRIDLRACGDVAREAILTHAAPLGRILIDDGVLTDVAYDSFLEFAPDPRIMDPLGAKESEPFFGRLASIHTNGGHAVDLLEIMPVNVER